MVLGRVRRGRRASRDAGAVGLCQARDESSFRLPTAPQRQSISGAQHELVICVDLHAGAASATRIAEQEFKKGRNSAIPRH